MTVLDQVDSINKSYRGMQKKVLLLMTHPEATAQHVEIARKVLIATAAALVDMQNELEKNGLTVERLEGITRKLRLGSTR